MIFFNLTSFRCQNHQEKGTEEVTETEVGAEMGPRIEAEVGTETTMKGRKTRNRSLKFTWRSFTEGPEKMT